MKMKLFANLEIKKYSKTALCWLAKHFIDCLFWGVFAAFSCAFVFAAWEWDGGYIANLVGAVNKKGIPNKLETLKFIGLGIGGVLAVIGAVAVNRRAGAQVKSAQAQAESAAAQAENNKLIEKGYINERFKSAVENLTNDSPSARLASFFQFYYFAKNNPDKDMVQNILDILCAHLRHATNTQEYREGIGKESPTEEVKTLFDIVANDGGKYERVFNDMKINLNDAYLAGMPLNLTDDSDGTLTSIAYLKGARLMKINFQNAKLQFAILNDANLEGAKLQGADLSGAELKSAKLGDANLQNANLFLADLSSADLSFADLSSANLDKANFTDACLTGVHFYGAKNADKAKFDKAAWNESIKFPPNITFTDKNGKKYKTDEKGIPQEMPEGE